MAASFIESEKSDGIVTLTMARGKVNAINGAVVDEIRAAFQNLERDSDVQAIILTGAGKFFSFGFDIPELLSWDKERFKRFVVNFTDLYTYLFLYPKPVVASINGHAVAGGCMLALACDYRIMAAGKAKISLNEITFASTIFAGSTEMLRFWVGNANATRVLVSGAMYGAEEALRVGLVDAIGDDAATIARELGAKAPAAFASMKSLLRKPIVDDMRRREADSISAFVEIWYSAPTRANLQNITIR